MNASGNASLNASDTHAQTRLAGATPIPPHQLPTSSRNDALAPRVEEQPVRVRVSEIDPWDALTRVICLIRPDWTPEQVRPALLRDKRPPLHLVPAAVTAAADPGIRTPGGIASHATTGPTPTPPNLRGDQCPTHLGERAGACRGCRADAIANGETT